VAAALVALAVTAGAGAAWATAGSGDGAPARVAPAQVEAFEESIFGPVKRGGRVVEQGMKPAVQAVAEGDPSSVVLQAVTWVDELDAARAELTALTPPDGPGLGHITAGLAGALASYAEAARTIGAAAIATGEPRSRLLAQAVAAARAADDEYDRASALLQAARRRAGLPPSTRFPDPKD
jgi:hypothetical protein